MKERQNNCGLFSCLQEEEEVTALVAVVEEVVGEPSRGSRVTLYHHEVHTNQDKTTHLPSKGGGGLVGVGCNCRLCYYGNAEFSVFFLASLMSTCEQTHTCGKCSATGADGPAATCRRFPVL